ncbi:DUF397 domain-containing protein [Amycolatopsis antarctica]|uniref:DUF397 domain-containing protein n=1 Tax=Amycolatopsis antarctica TaxID=1854586 RepID=A0A263D8B8_9PSEU|nr:DUF397 domain-containing protein [Amycolatopsis antarctica]OZM73726.1 DUF397 domain-containing protein [Amycolatopsis antarctica]
MSTPEPRITWRVSSHSAGNGNCVEVGWRTSSHSAGNGGCVEVREVPGEVHVRDTKNRTGGELHLPREGWNAFLTTIRA